jgi:hypothetical protein
VTVSGSLVGTPAYIAPEVASGDAGHTTSSDVYALGVILFECLTGHPPFENDSPLALLKLISDADVPAPSHLRRDLHPDLEAVCLHALNKDPSRRYSTAEGFAQDLQAWLRGDAVQARPTTWADRTWRWAQRNQTRAVLYTMAAVSVLLIIIGTAVTSVTMSVERAANDELRRRSELRLSLALQRLGSLQMLSKETLAEAATTFSEALLTQPDVGAPSRTLAFSARVLARIAGHRSGLPIPGWQGEGISTAWFDAQETLHLTSAGGTFAYQDRAWLPSAAVTPASLAEGMLSARRSPTSAVTVVLTRKDQAGQTEWPLLTPSAVRVIGVHPLGKWLAVIDEGNVLRVFDLVTSKQVSPNLELDFTAQHIVWGRHSDQLAVFNDSQLTLYDW